MKKVILFLTIITTVAVTVLLSGAGLRETEKYGVDLEVMPYKSGNYYCSLKIKNLSTDSLVSAPKIVCMAGEVAEVLLEGDHTLKATILVGENGRSVEYSVDMSRNKSRFFSQSAKMLLSQ